MHQVVSIWIVLTGNSFWGGQGAKQVTKHAYQSTSIYLVTFPSLTSMREWTEFHACFFLWMLYMQESKKLVLLNNELFFVLGGSHLLFHNNGIDQFKTRYLFITLVQVKFCKHLEIKLASLK